MTVQETLQIIEIENIQSIKFDITQFRDDKKNQTTDQKIKNLIIDPVIILEKETLTIKTDQKNYLSQHIELLLNIQTSKTKTKEKVLGNIKVKSTENNFQMKQAQICQLLTIQKVRTIIRPHTL